MKKIYIIGIWGIGISWIARYYNEHGYEVHGSDKTDSELIQKLQSEWMNIIIWEDAERINESFEKVIYTEAVPKTQIELKKALDVNLLTLTYPEALAEIANQKKLITIAGTHGKSTTTSMTSLVLKNSEKNVNALVGSLLKEFWGKNVFFSKSEYFVLEACEYKRSFLNYKPFIGVITNIELDHLDYYKDLEDYISAFVDYTKNIVSGWYLIIDAKSENALKLANIRNDIHVVLMQEDGFIINPPAFGIPLDKGEKFFFPEMKLKIPGPHILFDAKLAFVVGKILGINDKEIKNSLEQYNGIWRRSEIIGLTQNENILMSDYGHHPTEISLNLEALKGKYNPSPLTPLPEGEGKSRKILTIFQPHQYNRTLELLEDFRNCFDDTDILVIPDIYESRDSAQDKAKINGEKLVQLINHPHKIFGNGLKNTLQIIKDFDAKYPWELVIILQGAGNVDDLRYDIEVK